MTSLLTRHHGDAYALGHSVPNQPTTIDTSRPHAEVTPDNGGYTATIYDPEPAQTHYPTIDAALDATAALLRAA